MDVFQQDIRNLLYTGEFYAVIAHSLYLPDMAKLHAVAEKYAGDDCLRIAGYFIDGLPVGCVGVDLSDPEKAVLHHLAVDPAHRSRGIGRKMIEQMMAQFAIRRLEAETDGDAVGFYRSCGFAVTSLGEKYPGVIRYRCSLDGTMKTKKGICLVS